MNDAPDRIWVDGDETGLENFLCWSWQRGSWNKSKEGVGEVEYIRADLVPAPSVTVETIIAVADEIMSDLSGYLADDLTTDDEMEAADLVRRTIASTFSAPGWQPIETAPRNGQDILGWSDGLMEVIYWDDCDTGPQWWCAGEELCSMEQPTHWMPLPAPPSEEGKP